MRHSNSTLRHVLQGALVVALSASVCTAQYIDRRLNRIHGRLEDNAKWDWQAHITTLDKLAPAPAVEMPRTTYADMLGRGYALIGELNYYSEKHGSDEAQGKKDMLEMGIFYGADVAWISTSHDSYKGAVFVRGGTYSTYHSGSDPYMHNGDVSSTSTYSTKDHFHDKTIKFVKGDVFYFVHDPELAAKQLELGRKKWETRVVEIPAMRAALAAKLDTVVKTLSATDASLFKGPVSREEYMRDIQAAEDEVKTGRCGYDDPWLTSTDYRDKVRWWDETRCEGLIRFSRLGTISSHVEHDEKKFDCSVLKDRDSRKLSGLEEIQADSHTFDCTEFQDPYSPQLSELHRVASDADHYLFENWTVIGDNVSPGLPEHILFEHFETGAEKSTPPSGASSAAPGSAPPNPSAAVVPVAPTPASAPPNPSAAVVTVVPRPSNEMKNGSFVYIWGKIGKWTDQDAAQELGSPVRHRPGNDQQKEIVEDIYAYPDPTQGMREFELAFDIKTKLLKRVFAYPSNMTWAQCKHLWGGNAFIIPMPDGGHIRVYVATRMTIELDKSDKVVSIGVF